MVKIKDHHNLSRDLKSGAVINNSKSLAQLARQSRQKYLDDQARLDKLEDDMSDIKHMLKQLIEK